MKPDEIKDIPSIKKLREEANQFMNFKKGWPFLKPILRLFGVDTRKIEEQLNELPEMYKEVMKITDIPDKFNDTFSDYGWIIIDSMNMDEAVQAIAIHENEGIEKAEEYLANSISPEWVESRINWLKYIEGFQPRFKLAQKALEDYKAGRYYASILVTLTLIDGWVNELNIIEHQRKGFFASDSNLSAWDSITCHSKGLQKLKELFSVERKQTRTEEITIPYRHGILHGMDLGYDNQIVAAKCWLALFAVRAWAIKADRNELSEPEPEVKPDPSWKDLFYIIKMNKKNKEFLENWKPRNIIVSKDIPASGESGDYPEGTPEKMLVEFFTYWMKKNYGYMSRCFSIMLDKKPADVREDFSWRKLKEFELIEVTDSSPSMTDIRARIVVDQVDSIKEFDWNFRLCYCLEDGELLFYGNEEGGVWGITTWR